MKFRSALAGLALSLVGCGAFAGPNPTGSVVAESCHSWGGASSLTGTSGYIGAAGYIMIFDATSPPADGAVNPLVWAYVPTAGSWSIWYGDVPAHFTNGVVVCASSTGPLTKTAYSTNTVFSAQVQ